MTQTPAGWFPDPQNPGQQRYWDGAAWTAHTQPGFPGPQPTVDGAVLALVLGILSLVSCGFLAGIPAMIVGRRAIARVDASGGTLGGRGLAQGGFWTGLAGTVISVLSLVFVVVVFAFVGLESDSLLDDCTTQTTDSGTITTCN